MPRGKKKKVIVVYGPNGQIIKHMYLNNKTNVKGADAVAKVYDPATRKHVKGGDCKIKDERHSS